MSVEKLDGIFKKISKEITGSENLSFLDNLKDVISSISKRLDYTVSDYSSVTSSILQNFDKQSNIEQKLSEIQPEKSRVFRYREYEYITNRITYIQRGLNILAQNILSPDDVTKLMFDITGDEKRYGYKLIEELSIDISAINIIFKTLQLGDFFVELVTDETYKKHMKALLTETELNKKVLVEVSSNVKAPTKKKSAPVKLKYHHPSNVVVLGYDDVVLGYLVFPNISNSKLFPGQSLGIPIYQIPMFGVNTAMNIDTTTDIEQTKKKVADFSKEILKNLLKDKYDDKTFSIAKSEISDVILTLLMNLESNSNIEVRFVPPERMVHFKLVPSEFSPYGQSKLRGLEIAARNLIALENAIVYYRLTRSIDRRIFHVEVGKTKDVQDKLQSFIRSLKRQRINIESMAIDEIASKIGQFEDVFAPMRDGKRFVEIDSIQNPQLNITVEDWEKMRDMLVAGLEVPPAYLGIEQNYETRGTLSQENIVFAVTVLNYQRLFRRYFQELLKKVGRYRYGEDLDLTVEFKPPVKLLLEKYSEMIQSFAGMKDILDAVGISSKAVFRKYFGDLLDDKEEKAAMVDKMQDTILNPNQGETGGSTGGFGF